MELKNISEIARLEDDALMEYSQNLATEQGYDPDLVYQALDSLRQFNIRQPERIYDHRTVVLYVYKKAKSLYYSPEAIDNFVDFNNVIRNFTSEVGNLCILPLHYPNGELKFLTTMYNQVLSLQTSHDTEWDCFDRQSDNYWSWYENRGDWGSNYNNTLDIRIRQYLNFLGVRELDEEERNIIPQNSNSINIDESTTRFSSALWFNEIQNKVIILAGIGGIGSYVALLLARMKPKAMFLYDDDNVETVNMAGQLYSIKDVGKKKVDALAEICSSFALYNSVFATPEKFTLQSEPADIMICGFDNMKARKLFFYKWLNHVELLSDEHKKHCLFIDGRLAAEEYQVFCIVGDDTYNIELYQRKYLFDDAQADATVCSYKQTSYMANMIGSMIVNLFVNFVANEVTEGIRDLPFLTSYEGESLMFETQQ